MTTFTIQPAIQLELVARLTERAAKHAPMTEIATWARNNLTGHEPWDLEIDLCDYPELCLIEIAQQIELGQWQPTRPRKGATRRTTMLKTITMIAAEAQAIRLVLATIAAVTSERTWAEVQSDEEEPNPRADDDQAQRLESMARFLEQQPANRSVPWTMSELDAQDLTDALEWAEGQLAWAPLWEMARAIDSREWQEAEDVVLDGALVAKLREV